MVPALAGQPGQQAGRPERNYWRQVYQLNTTERWEVGQDTSRAAGLLARLARERGHHLKNHR